MNDSDITLSLTLDAKLVRAAEQCAADCGFANVQELITYLLQGVLRVQDRSLDEQELQRIETRLRDLGYLD